MYAYDDEGLVKLFVVDTVVWLLLTFTLVGVALEGALETTPPLPIDLSCVVDPVIPLFDPNPILPCPTNPLNNEKSK